jgi:phosphohistidine phosphatase
LMGRFISGKKVLPDLVLSSTAARARETAELAIAAMRAPVDLRYDERLYLASVPTLLEVVSQIDDDRRRPLLIGHNPGLEDLVFRLTGKARTVPTGALAKITLDIDRWSEAAGTSGVLDWLAKPRELEET